VTDEVAIRGLRVFGRHGVHEHERREGQPFVVDAVLELDTADAAGSDDLADTVDYAALSERLAAVVAGEPVALLETLADRLARLCLDESPRVTAVRISVHKPAAALPAAVDDVVVSIRRARG
jgi:dihydroneopterin aldolase